MALQAKNDPADHAVHTACQGQHGLNTFCHGYCSRPDTSQQLIAQMVNAPSIMHNQETMQTSHQNCGYACNPS
jgi:hypothetical protein